MSQSAIGTLVDRTSRYQYFPKRTDLSVHTLADLLAVEERLNHRPRRVLGWQTPAQIFHAAVTR